MLSLVFASPSPAAKACSYPGNPYPGGFPTIAKLRVTHISCTNGVGVANALAASWYKRGRLPHRARWGGGPWLTCDYTFVKHGDGGYDIARCTRGRRVFQARLYS